MFLVQDRRTNLSFLIRITLVIMMISSVTGQPTYNYLICSGRSNNDTANTNYKTNLNTLLGSLSSKAANGSSFYNDTANTNYKTNLNTLLGSLSSKAANGSSFYNDTSNNIYSLYLCRGDVASNICQNCVDAAIQKIQQNCTSDKEAIVWYDECMLRYSDNNFFGSVELSPRLLMWNVMDRNQTSPNDTDVKTLALMYRLTAKAGTEQMKYAHGESDASNVTNNRYGMVQCSRDISGDACSNSCLGKLMEFAQKCCQEKKGWRILAPSCNLRYEEYPFLTPSVTSTPSPAPSTKGESPPPVPSTPPPVPSAKGNGGNNTTKIVLITVPISTFLVAAFGFYFYRLFGRSKAREINGVQIEGMSQEILLNNLEGQTRKRFMVEGLDVKDDDDSGEMHYFKLTTIQIATDNFSDANKLGQGGFGPVYNVKNNISTRYKHVLKICILYHLS